MAYLIITGFIMLFLTGAVVKVYNLGQASGKEACQRAIADADLKLTIAAEAAKQEAANHIVDMEAAYEVGESKAKTIYVKAQAKGVQDVATYPVFSNPICVLPADSLRNLNSARSGLRTAADTTTSDAAVRGTGVVDGGAPARPLPTDAQGRRPLGKVH